MISLNLTRFCLLGSFIAHIGAWYLLAPNIMSISESSNTIPQFSINLEVSHIEKSWPHSKHFSSSSVKATNDVNPDQKFMIGNKVSARHILTNQQPQVLESMPSQDKLTHRTKLYRELLAELHKTISRHQVYPRLAKRLGHTGTTSLNFNINSLGVITDIKLKKSSGYRNLDKAAVTTLNQISPFKLAEQHLSTSQKFTVAIQFK